MMQRFVEFSRIIEISVNNLINVVKMGARQGMDNVLKQQALARSKGLWFFN